jgi:hypothetical protein
LPSPQIWFADFKNRRVIFLVEPRFNPQPAAVHQRELQRGKSQPGHAGGGTQLWRFAPCSNDNRYLCLSALRQYLVRQLSTSGTHFSDCITFIENW